MSLFDLRVNYGVTGLAAVLPSVTASLGVPQPASAPVVDLAPARSAIVVLIDALGYELLDQRRGHARFLAGLMADGHRLSAGFPATTATSMATFGTGLPPGAHGLLGYEVLDPATDALFNELNWENGPDPQQWQPAQTAFERAEADGVAVARIGPAYFDGSGLTKAALRGGQFIAARGLAARVEAALAFVRAHRRALVYLYWGDLDKVGHVHGCGSWQFGEELEAIDAQMAHLFRAAGADTSVYLTADHGMVDVPHEQRIDAAAAPELTQGLRHLGGEARARYLYCEPDTIDAVAARWQERIGERGSVLTRAQAIEAGWFGPVSPHVLPRIGDLVVLLGPDLAVVDSRRDRPELLALRGMHGSITPVERDVPLLGRPATRS